MFAKQDSQKIAKLCGSAMPNSGIAKYTMEVSDLDSKSTRKEFSKNAHAVIKFITKLHDVTGKKIEHEVTLDEENDDLIVKLVLHLDKPTMSSLFNTNLQMYGKSSFEFGQMTSKLSSSRTDHKADHLVMTTVDLSSLVVKSSSASTLKSFAKYLFKSSLKKNKEAPKYARKGLENMINHLVSTEAGRIQISNTKSLYPVRAINFLAVWSLFNADNVSSVDVNSKMLDGNVSRLYVESPEESIFSNYLHKNQGKKGGLKDKVLIEKNMLRANHVDVQLKTPMIYEENSKKVMVAIVGTGWGKVSYNFNSVMQDAQLSIKSFIETVYSTDYDNFVMATVSSQEKIGRAALAFNNNAPFDEVLEKLKHKKSYSKKILKNNIRGKMEVKQQLWVDRAIRMVTYMRSHLQIQLMCQGIEHLLSTASISQGTIMMESVVELAKAYREEYIPVDLQITGTTRAEKTIEATEYGSPSAVVFIDGSTEEDNEASRTKNAIYIKFMNPIEQMISDNTSTSTEQESEDQEEQDQEELDNIAEDTDIEEPESAPEESDADQEEESDADQEELDNIAEDTNLEEPEDTQMV